MILGRPVTFTAAVNSSPPYTVQWMKDNVDIEGATSFSYTIPAVTQDLDNTKYSVKVSNLQFNGTSRQAILRINPDNVIPTLVSGSSAGPRQVRLVFSEEMDEATAEDINNYIVDQGAVFLNSAELLADRVWDGNVPKPSPIVLLANAAQQRRIDAIARELPPLQAALSARASQLPKSLPVPPPEPDKPAAEAGASTAKAEKKAEPPPIVYEVIWAEDGDLPTPANFGAPAPAGEWRTGKDVPVVGGQRALRLVGTVTNRVIPFATGETPLLVATEAVAFVHLYPDPTRPPRALPTMRSTRERRPRSRT